MANFNHEAERYVLGSCLKDKEVIPEVLEILTPSDFNDPRNAEIFGVIVDLYNSHKPVDLIAVSEELTNAKSLIEITYLAALTNAIHTTANTLSHAKLVKEKAIIRQVIRAGKGIVGLAESTDFETTEELLSQAESMIYEVGNSQLKGQLTDVKTVLLSHIDTIFEREKQRGLTGLSTGLPPLDAWTAGLQNTDLIIVAARPSMGKTALTLQLAKHVSKTDTVAFFSLEMSKFQLVERLLVNEAMVDGYAVRTGQLTEEDKFKISRSLDRVASLKLIIDDSSGLSVPEIYSKARRIKSKSGLGLVVIDYLQLMKSHKRRDNRQGEISEISQALKNMAKDLNVPVIAVSQLSRAVEQRQEKIPMMSDLRESGSIEQDADLIMFIYRDDYYYKDSKTPGIADIIIAKQRNGPVGSLSLAFLKQFQRFTKP